MSPRLISPLLKRASLLIVSLWISDAQAQIKSAEDPIEKSGQGDGVYGRFEGDLSLRAGLGLEFDPSQEALRPLTLFHLAAYQTVGFYGSFRMGLADEDSTLRVGSLGLTLTPLFLWRWSSARESGWAMGDLLLDSIGLSCGAHLTHSRLGSPVDEPGLELGALFGIPLLAKANGPWLRARAQLLTGRPPRAGEESPEGTIWLYLAWEKFFNAGLLPVD